MNINLKILLKNPRLAIFPAVIIILIVISFKFGFSRTWNRISTCNDLLKKLEKIDQEESDPRYLEQKLTDLEHQIGFSNLPETEIRQNILDRLMVAGSLFTFRITRIPPANIYQEDDFEVIINTFSVEGNYDHLLRLLNKLEFDREVPKIISSCFRLNKDRITNKTSLSLSLYFQTIRKTNR